MDAPGTVGSCPRAYRGAAAGGFTLQRPAGSAPRPRGGRAHGHVSCSLQQRGAGAGSGKGRAEQGDAGAHASYRPAMGSASWCRGPPVQGTEPAVVAVPGSRAAPAHSSSSTHPATAQDCFPVNKFVSSDIWDSINPTFFLSGKAGSSPFPAAAPSVSPSALRRRGRLLLRLQPAQPQSQPQHHGSHRAGSGEKGPSAAHAALDLPLVTKFI